MTAFNKNFPTTGLLFCAFALLASLGLSTAAAARHPYVNRHTVSTTRVVAPGVTILRGRASWYGAYFQGSRTTSGERYDRFQYTCAHRTLPFGTRLRVTSVKGRQSVVVRVSDRGPFRHQRIIDLSEIAGAHLNLVELGAAPVLAEVVACTTPLGPCAPPANLLALLAADPDPTAAHATYAALTTPAPVSLAQTLAAAPTASASTVAPALDSLPLLSVDLAAPVAPGFVLQAGTFADLQSAQALKARILAFDPALPVALETETVAGRELNRVLIGQLDSWLAAETVRRNLQFVGIVGQVRQVPTAPPLPASLATAAILRP